MFDDKKTAGATMRLLLCIGALLVQTFASAFAEARGSYVDEYGLWSEQQGVFNALFYGAKMSSAARYSGTCACNLFEWRVTDALGSQVEDWNSRRKQINRGAEQTVDGIRCSADMSERGSAVTEDWGGIPLSREYWFNPHGVWFKVPFGHLFPWPGDEYERLLRLRSPDNPDPPGLGLPTLFHFSFWMPDLRWPEQNGSDFALSFRPCESGRPAPTDEQYVAVGVLKWPWLPGPTEPHFIPPDVRFEGMQRKGEVLAIDDVGAPEGLSRIVVRGTKIRFFYSNDYVKKRSLFRCRVVDSVYRCIGDVWWPNEGLGISINFPQSRLRDWQDIADGARKLLSGWRLNSVAK